jgi:sialic acid synthase SpsE
MGRSHKVVCKNNTEIKKAMAFFSELKKESLAISRIIAEYPMSYGQVAKKFIPEVRRELKAIGLNNKTIEKVLIMYWA